MVEMKLSKIVINETTDQQVIVLVEAGGERSFPIMIGPYEALAIRRGVREEATPRPLTHDLLLSVIRSLSDGLDHVEITELKNHTFYANLLVKQNGRIVAIDARPSDAIALAVAVRCRILCHEDVLNEVVQEPPAP